MLSHISLKQLIMFTKIVRTNSITDAAYETNLSASAVSKSLQSLESTLGVNLVQRTTRNITITTEGQRFYNKINVLLEELENALDEISATDSEPKGNIRVTCSLALGSTQLMRLFAIYKLKYPKVNLVIDLNDKLINLNDGDFDVALRITKKPPDNVSIRKLSPINWVFCASKQYVERYGEPKLLEDLKQHSGLINPNIEEVLYEDIAMDQLHKVRYKDIIVKSNSSLALLEAVLLSLGIARLPTYLLDEHIKKGALVPLLTQYHHDTYHLYALYPLSKKLNPKIRTLIDFLNTHLNPIAPWDDSF